LAELAGYVLTSEALFSKQDTSISHGDPHAGNIMRIEDNALEEMRSSDVEIKPPVETLTNTKSAAS